jgi:hypothetical protein
MLRIEKDFRRLRAMTQFRAGTDILTSADAPPLVIDDRWRYLKPSDQGKTSRCATEAMLSATEAARWEAFGKMEQLDAPAAYKKALVREYETNEDAGTSLFTPIEVQALDDKTIEECALTNQRAVMDIVTVEALANQIMRLRHRYGFGNLVGLNITEAMLNANADGTIPDGQSKVVGPHGMTICGYMAPIIGNQVFLVNSWGDKHAWNGFVRLTWEQLFAQFLYAVGFELKVRQTNA